MQLTRAFAFEVSPGQPAPYTGGVITSPAVQSALEGAFREAALDRAPGINLVVSTGRAHLVRDALMDLAFGSGAKAAKAAADLTARLANVMDGRSKPTLFLASVHPGQQTKEQRVVLWTFPREDVFDLETNTSGSTALQVTQAFSRESRLRKAATFVGLNTKSDFLQGRALDLQSSSATKSIADLWIDRFLGGVLQMSDEEGTKMLARALRSAHDHFEGEPGKQAQIHAAITTILANPRKKSLQKIASDYFDQEVASEVMSVAKTPAMASSPFTVQPQRLEQLVQYSIYELENGIHVSAPFGSADGLTVTQDDDGQRHLWADGIVERQKLRNRHG